MTTRKTFADQVLGPHGLSYYRETLGFNATEQVGGALRIRCSACVAVVIDGQPAHQRSCAKSPGSPTT